MDLFSKVFFSLSIVFSYMLVTRIHSLVHEMKNGRKIELLRPEVTRGLHVISMTIILVRFFIE
jgi:hypothetical protein